MLDCGMLSAPSDGSITLTGTTYLSVATFECDVGYDLSGSASRVCQADTAWNGTTTLCVIRGKHELHFVPPTAGYIYTCKQNVHLSKL